MKPRHNCLASVAVLLPVLALTSIAGAAKSNVKGHLVFIGGGKQPPEVLKRFVELAGGTPHAKIIVVNPDDTFEVPGENSARVLNARAAGSIRPDATGNLAGKGIRIDLLLAGDRFDLVRGTVLERAQGRVK